MATLHASPTDTGAAAGDLSIARCALTGAGVGLALLVIGWLTSWMNPFGMMSVRPFMMGGWWSLAGLLYGLVCATLGGLLVGALIAGAYNLAGRLLNR